MLPDFIDVLPELSLGIAPLPTQLRVQIETQGQLPEVWVGALGNMPKKLDTDTRQNAPSSSSVIYPDGKARTRWVSERGSFDHLDGHILLRWNDRGEQKLFICGYSHGGGPCTGGGGYCVCYTAGSYEGNSMIFFRDNYDSADTRKPLPTAQKFSDAGMRIVSTVMHKGPQFLESASNDVFEARSYIFSFGSSQKLSEHSATLVLYYDERARKQNGDLLVYRWGGSAGWQRLTTYAPENRPYVCIPLDEATPETSSNSPSIIGRSNEYVDRYRIYWTPRA
jgi:hypothetical protein